MNVKIIAAPDFLKEYFVGFYLFGVYLRTPIGDSERCCKRYLLNIPRLIHLICAIFANLLHFRDVHIKTEPNIVYFPLILATVPNLLFIFNADSCLTKVDDIMSVLLEIENYLKKNMLVFVQTKLLKHKLSITFLVCVIIPSAVYFCKIFLRSPTFSIECDFSRFLSMAYKFWGLFLVLIFIEYRNFLIFSLNQKLMSTKLFHLDSNTWSLFHLLEHIRMVHIKLHRLSTMINKHFGWFLLTILLDHFTNITSTFLYLFMASVDPDLRFKMARK